MLAALLVFWDYWRRSRKYFGGLSGDLAGWFLQRVELWMLAAVWIVEWGGASSVIFVTGPLFAGKREYICKALGWSEEDLARQGIWEVQNLAGQEEDLEKLAKNLAQYEVVIATEVGGGVVPVDPVQRQNRGRGALGLPFSPAGGPGGSLFSVVCLRR